MNQTEQPNYQGNDYDEIDLKDIILTIGKWKYKIIAVTLICMLFSGIISWFFIEPVYEVATIIAVNQGTKPAANTQNPENIEKIFDQLGDVPLITPQSSVQQISSASILDSTIKKLNLPYSRGALMSMISTELIKDTNLVKIKVSNTDPVLAAQIANTVRDEFLTHVNQVNGQKLTKSLDTMENQWLQKE
ncbi:MAG: Wzz/FepE/Etk N-terminal domain-containing protein, partial [Syntrophomonas sp.]|nr:Wzz/FepE/Etk N-terminal domain-containing protein [Syntrophomonas sp.]